MSLRQRLGLGGLKSKTVVWLTTGVGSLLAAGVAGLMTVAEALPKQELSQFSPGMEIVGSQWRIVPQRAWVGHATPDDRPTKPGRKVLVVELDMTNQTSQTSNDYADVLQLAPDLAAKTDRPRGYLERDHAILFQLHPELTERVAIAWEMPDDVVTPDPLPLTVFAGVYRKRGWLTGTSGWMSDRPIGTVTLPVTAVPHQTTDPT